MKVIDFQITAQCNLECRFCCDSLKSCKSSSYDQIERMIKKISKTSVETISLTGGEPLLFTNIVSVINCLKKNNINIYLSTNGILLQKFYDDILPQIETIGLPIDSINTNTLKLIGRNQNQYELNLRHIKYIQEKYPKIKIKIGTVVSQYNINELEELGEKLSKILRKNDVWRLYQFSPIGIGKLNESDFFIDEDKFNSEIKKIKMKYDNINISPLSVEEANDAYIFITPDLRLAEFTNNMFDFINYLENLSQEEIEDILCNDRKILKNIEHNREWLKP